MITKSIREDGVLPIKHSKQRDAILENLRGRYDHPTAEMVYNSLREDFPHISLGTVYRNLALLCEVGDIIKVGTSDDGKEHYDGHTHPHSHFFCQHCKEIYDLDVFLDIKSIEDSLGAEIHYASNTFYGKCRNCLE
jgi:Fur family peroxide stress response transcriptional regulator